MSRILFLVFIQMCHAYFWMNICLFQYKIGCHAYFLSENWNCYKINKKIKNFLRHCFLKNVELSRSFKLLKNTRFAGFFDRIWCASVPMHVLRYFDFYEWYFHDENHTNHQSFALVEKTSNLPLFCLYNVNRNANYAAGRCSFLMGLTAFYYVSTAFDFEPFGNHFRPISNRPISRGFQGDSHKIDTGLTRLIRLVGIVKRS